MCFEYAKSIFFTYNKFTRSWPYKSNGTNFVAHNSDLFFEGTWGVETPTEKPILMFEPNYGRLSWPHLLYRVNCTADSPITKKKFVYIFLTPPLHACQKQLYRESVHIFRLILSQFINQFCVQSFHDTYILKPDQNLVDKGKIIYPEFTVA